MGAEGVAIGAVTFQTKRTTPKLQSFAALTSGRGGRKFESSHPDQVSIGKRQFLPPPTRQKEAFSGKSVVQQSHHSKKAKSTKSNAIRSSSNFLELCLWHISKIACIDPVKTCTGPKLEERT